MMPSTFLPPRPLCSNCLARFYYGSLAAGKAPKTNSKNRPLKKDDLEEAGAAPSTKCFVLPPKTVCLWKTLYFNLYCILIELKTLE
jgi:hypothetical protein